MGSCDQASQKTRLTQKLLWKALKRLLMKEEIDESNSGGYHLCNQI